MYRHLLHQSFEEIFLREKKFEEIMKLVIAQNAHTLLSSAQQFVTNHETLAIGVTTYVTGLILLDMLEKTRTRNNLPTTRWMRQKITKNLKNTSL